MTTRIRVLFACAWGMSSSLLAEKVRMAGGKREVDIVVDCVAAETAMSCEIDQYDMVLLGPQVKYYKEKFEGIVKDAGLDIPVSPVDGMLYAMADGEAVLEQVLRAVEKAKGNTRGNPGEEVPMSD